MSCLALGVQKRFSRGDRTDGFPLVEQLQARLCPCGLRAAVAQNVARFAPGHCDQPGTWSRRQLKIRHISETANALMGTQLESSCFSNFSLLFHFIMNYIYPFYLLVFCEDKFSSSNNDSDFFNLFLGTLSQYPIYVQRRRMYIYSINLSFYFRGFLCFTEQFSLIKQVFFLSVATLRLWNITSCYSTLYQLTYNASNLTSFANG